MKRANINVKLDCWQLTHQFSTWYDTIRS